VRCSMSWLIRSSALSRTYQSATSAELDAGEKDTSVHFPPIEIEQGGLIAVVGLSGSGKSTLLNLLGGLDRPDPAAKTATIELNLDGDPIEIIASPAEFPRKRVGFIFQQGTLLENLSVGMNIGLPSLISGRAISNTQIEQLLGELNLAPSFRTKRAWQLSGGEAQRVGFARAVSHDPLLLFLDEPTSNLDFTNAERLMKWVQDWKNANPYRTAIWVTHDADLVAKFADGILVLGTDVGQSGTLRPIFNPENSDTIRNWVQNPSSAPISSEQVAAIEPSCASNRRTVALSVEVPFAGRPPSKTSIGLRLAISEMCAKRRESTTIKKEQPFANWLASVEREPSRSPFSSLLAAVRAFSDLPQLISLICAIVIAASIVAAIRYGFVAYDNVMSDPRNCHVVVTGSIAAAAPSDAASNPSQLKAVELNSDLVEKSRNRSQWEPKNRVVQPTVGFEYAPADCKSGDGAFGRRDFQPWEIGFVDSDSDPPKEQQANCQGIESTFRMMVTEPNEPLLQTIKFVGATESQYRTVADYFFDPTVFSNKEIFITRTLADALRSYLAKNQPQAKARFQDLPVELCLMNVAVGQHEVFRLAGVVDGLPAPRITKYDFLITESNYQTMARGARIPAVFSQVVFYFDPSNISGIERFLADNGLVFIHDSLDLLKRQISGYKLLSGVFLFFIVVVMNYIFITCVSNVQIYLKSSGASLAVLRSFGFDHLWLRRVVLCRQLLLFGIAAVGASLLAIVLCLFISISPASVFERYNGTETSVVIFVLQGFVLSELSLSLTIILICLDSVRKWWQRYLYIALLLR
jgi:ABC-type lipoprotein export system ATPase subunit